MMLTRRPRVGLYRGWVIALALCCNTTASGQSELARLTPLDAAAGKHFGNAVAIDGDYAIVGARLDGPPTSAGAAYVFRHDPEGWVEEAKLVARTTAGAQERFAGDEFGMSVAISGDVAVVGSWQDTHLTMKSGSAYVFRRSGTMWTMEAKLVASDRMTGDRFGIAVAAEGDWIVVGADRADASGVADCGAAYVFNRVSASWMQVAKLAASDAQSFDSFGAAVSLSGESVAVGARFEEALGMPSSANSGAVYVFRRDGAGTWALDAKLVAPDAAQGDTFGESVAVNADALVAGARLDDDAGSESGSAHVFRRTGGSWMHEAKLAASDAWTGDNFGNSVALDADAIVVGSFLNSGQAGAFYLFNFNGTSWDQTSKAFASDSGDFDQFANAVAIDGAMIMVGCAADDDAAGAESGSVYMFDATPAAPSDSDGDGLNDSDELALGTSANNPDTDGDELSDGMEVSTAGTDPLNPDTDSDGWFDGAEIAAGTSPLNADTDGDGMGDGAENAAAAGSSCPDPLVADSDGDGLADGADVTAGLSPCATDTDGDALSDGLELAFGTSGLDPDTDNDGMTDGAEVSAAAGTGCPNPLVADSDGDGLEDGFETTSGFGACNADLDGDGLSDGMEFNIGTNPLNPDTDADNMPDGSEVAMAAGSSCPDPRDMDSDNDGISDGDEVTAGLGPCDADSDEDGLSDGNEEVYGTNALIADTDSDGLLDGTEVDVASGTGCPNPLVADSDGDTRSDGAEAAAGTNACSIDTDGDGLTDSVDPLPTTPGAPPAYLAQMGFAIADDVRGMDLALFLGPNNNSRLGRRVMLATYMAVAGRAIELGAYGAAMSALSAAEVRIDDASPPADWMGTSPEKAALHAEIQTLIVLVDMLQ